MKSTRRRARRGAAGRRPVRRLRPSPLEPCRRWRRHGRCLVSATRPRRPAAPGRRWRPSWTRSARR
ncbi:MAG: hypothetical protein EOO66_06405 [Methylobacterium sp.]|nr:MAG: hypothetical protein EOO66_06405 [Methylobacterium sp.]